MAANGISTLATKEARQLAKLELAATNRAEDERRSIYDITQLPTQYSGNAIIDNLNEGGLIEGRPWLAFGTGDYVLITEDDDTIITESSDTLITE